MLLRGPYVPVSGAVVAAERDAAQALAARAAAGKEEALTGDHPLLEASVDAPQACAGYRSGLNGNSEYSRSGFEVNAAAVQRMPAAMPIIDWLR